MPRNPRLAVPPRPVPVLLRHWDALDLVLVGCGGTGSWLAPHLARLSGELAARGRPTRLLLVDPDRVAPENLGRQAFCPAELGQPKALALAARLRAAYGLEVGTLVAPLSAAGLPPPLGRAPLRVLVGAVDNAPARAALAAALAASNRDRRPEEPPTGWWLDAGNDAHSGQVLLGSAATAAPLRVAFARPGVCCALPSPTLQHPDLLRPPPADLPAAALSCAQMAARDAQSLSINAAVAAVAADFLFRLLLAGTLGRFATYLNLDYGNALSYPTTPAAVGRVLAQPARWFRAPPRT